MELKKSLLLRGIKRQVEHTSSEITEIPQLARWGSPEIPMGLPFTKRRMHFDDHVSKRRYHYVYQDAP